MTCDRGAAAKRSIHGQTCHAPTAALQRGLGTRPWRPDFGQVVHDERCKREDGLTAAIRMLEATDPLIVPPNWLAVFSIQKNTKRQYASVLRALQRRLDGRILDVITLDEYIFCVVTQKGPFSTLRQLLSALSLAHLCGADVPKPTPRMWRTLAVHRSLVEVRGTPRRPLIDPQWFRLAAVDPCAPLFAPLWLMFGCALRGGELHLVRDVARPLGPNDGARVLFSAPRKHHVMVQPLIVPVGLVEVWKAWQAAGRPVPRAESWGNRATRHAGRRSWATFSYHLGLPPQLVRQRLQHADKGAALMDYIVPMADDAVRELAEVLMPVAHLIYTPAERKHVLLD